MSPRTLARFEEEFEAFRSQLDAYITRFYAQEAQRRDYTSSFYRKIHEQMHEFTTNAGKRLRALLTAISYIGYSDARFGEPQIENIIPAAASVETLHSFFLIHDDILDQDEIRRGKPAMHIRMRELLPKGKTSGEDLAIVVGDIAFFHALSMLLETNETPERILAAQRALLDAAINTGIGELYDLLDDNQKLTDVTFENVLFVMTYKTSRYTIQLPLAMGAALAGADRTPEDFEEIATLLGSAFQLQDDLLGIFGDEHKLGKPVKSDIQEGKKTLIMKWLYDECNTKERTFLMNTLGTNLTDEDFAKIRSMIEEKGIRTRVEKYIEELLTESRKEVGNLKMNKAGAEYLTQIVDALAGREK